MASETKKIAIYGAGGFAREVAWLVQSCNLGANHYEVVCFLDDFVDVEDKILNGIPVVKLESVVQRFPDAAVVGGVGNSQLRQRLMAKAAALGLSFETIVHPRVEKSDWIELGIGTVICAGNILTTNIRIGRHVQINLDCTIGHDVVMDDFVTLAPGVHVSGNVRFGKRVYVGTGAVILNGTSDKPIMIGDDAVIGAGACVTKSVPQEQTVVGVPAKPIQRK